MASCDGILLPQLDLLRGDNLPSLADGHGGAAHKVVPLSKAPDPGEGWELPDVFQAGHPGRVGKFQSFEQLLQQ